MTVDRRAIEKIDFIIKDVWQDEPFSHEQRMSLIKDFVNMFANWGEKEGHTFTDFNDFMSYYLKSRNFKNYKEA